MFTMIMVVLILLGALGSASIYTTKMNVSPACRAFPLTRSWFESFYNGGIDQARAPLRIAAEMQPNTVSFDSLDLEFAAGNIYSGISGWTMSSQFKER